MGHDGPFEHCCARGPENAQPSTIAATAGLARRRHPALWAALAAVWLTGCSSAPTAKYREMSLVDVLAPSNRRDWSPDQAVLSTAQFHGNEVTIRNIRNCHYRSTQDYDVRHYDKTFDLDSLETVDFFVVPFAGMPSLAHTMLSFGFAGQDYVCVSIEIRKERGESYSPVKGMLRRYELMYVVGDERDLVKLRTNYRLDDVYLYRGKATRQQARTLFRDVMDRVNKLAAVPEFYDTLLNNCTTNLMDHINKLSPNRVPYELRVLLPGYSDHLAYDLGLLDTTLPFDQAKVRARITDLAYIYRDDDDFSQRIRSRLEAGGAPLGDATVTDRRQPILLIQQ